VELDKTAPQHRLELRQDDAAQQRPLGVEIGRDAKHGDARLLQSPPH